jgi:hypothetical protein
MGSFRDESTESESGSAAKNVIRACLLFDFADFFVPHHAIAIEKSLPSIILAPWTKQPPPSSFNTRSTCGGSERIPSQTYSFDKRHKYTPSGHPLSSLQ